MTTTHDHTNLFTTLPPYPNEIPFTDFDLDLDLSLNDVFAPGMLESQAQQQHWELNPDHLDMPGKCSSSGVFPVPNDFGFNYPVDLVELGGMGLGLFEGEGGKGVISSPPQDHTQDQNTTTTTTLNTLLRSTSYQATQRALYMTTPTTPTSPHQIYSPSSPSPTSPTSSHNPDTISNSDTDSISFGPRTPPPQTPIYNYNYNPESNSKKRKASTEIDLDSGIHHHTYNNSTIYSQSGGGELGVLTEEQLEHYHNHNQQIAFYPSHSSGNNPKRRRSSVQSQLQPQSRSRSRSQSPTQSRFQEQEQEEEQEQEQEIFTPLEMPDGSTRFTSNWLPVDPSGGFTICPDPLVGVMGEAFVSVGS
ncbi:hypothetical protein BDV38DRAFT_285522 [Aspergillus pseudotamarii]|uniref:Uncharacterized protein n=1 Tax=Aspergillus pseudotamarii TaxID=132259 RepID=A0A5N6SJ87_ASPPS|nr:uncharacterized protein BDV38DRAFT_285522 [Aspergillus pseudotamarii]KAE8134746.1 hypothetical protein BDV38DRAFT_285522 [Aspergillus pseudotamarii]